MRVALFMLISVASACAITFPDYSDATGGVGGTGQGATGGKTPAAGGMAGGMSCSDDADCQDADPCTIDDCVNGECRLSPAADDNDACTLDSCDPMTGRVTNLKIPVNDNNPCTFDTCNPETGETDPNELVIFESRFDDAAGWVFGPQWAIGPAVPSLGGKNNGNDPAVDHSAQGDGVAGTVVGGLVLPIEDTILTSPFISLADVKPGEYVGLRVWRYLSVDAPPDAATIDLSVDGVSAETIWSSATSGGGVIDDPAGPAGAGNGGGGWFELRLDLTSRVGGNVGGTTPIRVRFTLSKGAGQPSMGGWSIDDMRVVRRLVPFDDDQCTTDDCQQQDGMVAPLHGPVMPSDPTLCKAISCSIPEVGVIACTPP
ncbi:MAG: hypothetical protein U0271_04905 [Polyangiaceae bacterium]